MTVLSDATEAETRVGTRPPSESTAGSPPPAAQLYQRDGATAHLSVFSARQSFSFVSHRRGESRDSDRRENGAWR